MLRKLHVATYSLVILPHLHVPRLTRLSLGYVQNGHLSGVLSLIQQSNIRNRLKEICILSVLDLTTFAELTALLSHLDELQTLEIDITEHDGDDQLLLEALCWRHAPSYATARAAFEEREPPSIELPSHICPNLRTLELRWSDIKWSSVKAIIRSRLPQQPPLAHSSDDSWLLVGWRGSLLLHLRIVNPSRSFCNGSRRW